VDGRNKPGHDEDSATTFLITRGSIFLRKKVLRSGTDCRDISAFTRVFRRAMPGNHESVASTVAEDTASTRESGPAIGSRYNDVITAVRR
jgi:hypothetical protein